MAKGGSVLSMLYLANNYHRGPRADLSKAEKWYRAAYEKGALNSFAGLGAIYFGQGNYAEAKKVFLNGVSRDDGVSMYWLAKIYLKEESHIDRNNEIKELLERAMSLGQIRAKNRLSFLMMGGRYGIKNIPRGIFLYFSSMVDGFRVGLRNPGDRRLW